MVIGQDIDKEARACHATMAYRKRTNGRPVFHHPDTWSSMFSGIGWRSRNGEHLGETFESAILMGTQASSENSSSFSTVHRQQVKPIEIDGRGIIFSVVFLVDGQQWRGEDPTLEVGIRGDEHRSVTRWVVSGKCTVGFGQLARCQLPRQQTTISLGRPRCQ